MLKETISPEKMTEKEEKEDDDKEEDFEDSKTE